MNPTTLVCKWSAVDAAMGLQGKLCPMPCCESLKALAA